MSRALVPVDLDLTALPDECELSRPVAEAIALAASVVLHRLRPPRQVDPARVVQANSDQPANVRRAGVDARAEATYADPQEATEEGAEALAILAARRVLGRIVFRRLPKATGADYLMRDPAANDGDAYERLECSGIAEGEETVATRMGKKLGQLGKYPAQPAGHAAVTDFRPEVVAIHVARWSR
jgi:hypothetical protein